MIRSAVLTLGVITVLVGGSAARADGLSLADWPLLAPAPPATTGIFPRMPENWNDLPLQLHLSEQVGYNGNVANTPTGSGATRLYGSPIASLELISTYGASFRNEIGGQQFFADGTWGMYRYLKYDRYNSAHSSADIGDNFTYGSKCKGTLKASEVSAPSEPGQQIGYNVLNTTTTVAFNETAQCIVTGEYSAILNSGNTSVKNSSVVDRTNDYQSVFVAAGINYAVSETNSLQVLATVTGFNYTGRQGLVDVTGLVDKITTDQVMAIYTKNFGPDIALSAQAGLIGIQDQYFSLGIPHSVLPQYAISLQWTATPKIILNIALSRLATPPTSIISNLQITDLASAGFSFRWTPKLTISGSLQTSYISGTGANLETTSLISPLTDNQKNYGAGLKLSYAFSPFLGSELSYQYNRSVQSTLTTNTSLILLALNFNPY